MFNINLNKFRYSEMFKLPTSIKNYNNIVNWENLKDPIIWGYNCYGNKFIILKCLQGKKKITEMYSEYLYSKFYSIDKCQGENIGGIFYNNSYQLNLQTEELIKKLIINKEIIPNKYSINLFNKDINIYEKIELWEKNIYIWENLIKKKITYSILSKYLNNDVIIRIISLI